MAGLEERLFTQGTDFRTLKYGKDRPGGGSSREPFVNRNTLPGLTEQSPDLGLLGGNTDFLLRAGTLKRSADDVSRITQFFTTGKGLSFVAKQNLLSRTNVKTQAQSIGLNAGPYSPTSTIAQVGVSGLGFHLNKQGLNPFAATGTKAGDDGAPNNFLESIIGASKAPSYLSANIRGGDSGDTNRLVQLRKYKIIGPKLSPLEGPTNFLTRLAGRADDLLGTGDFLENKVADLIPNLNPELQQNNISNKKSEILAYGGGPDAELGIGNTRIKRYYFSDEYKRGGEFQKKYFILDGGQIESLADSSQVNSHKILPDFRNLLLNQQKKGTKKNILSSSPDYTRKNIEQRVGLGNPGTSQKNLTSYTNGTGNGAVDKVNAIPLYKSRGVTASPVKNDLIKFRIATIDPHDSTGMSTYIHFRAFLDSFQDNYASTWDSFKYMGRSEQFYKYQGFTREISLSWKIAAQSREELIILYKKLNFLQSTMAGDYSPLGYMEGNLMKLTVGGYLFEQAGFFTSLNVTFPEKATYEIGIPDPESESQLNTGQTIETRFDVKELPHYLEVSAGFTPIHDFVPRKQKNEFDYNDRGGGLTQYGRERFIALSADGTNTSYDEKNSKNDYFVNTPSSNVKVSTIKPAGVQPVEVATIQTTDTTSGLKALRDKNFSKGLG